MRTDSLAIYPPGIFYFSRPCLICVVATVGNREGRPRPRVSRAHLGVLLILFCTGLEILEKRIASDPPAEAGKETSRRDPCKGGNELDPPTTRPRATPPRVFIAGKVG